MRELTTHESYRESSTAARAARNYYGSELFPSSEIFQQVSQFGRSERGLRFLLRPCEAAGRRAAAAIPVPESSAHTWRFRGGRAEMAATPSWTFQNRCVRDGRGLTSGGRPRARMYRNRAAPRPRPRAGVAPSARHTSNIIKHEEPALRYATTRDRTH
ncbi:hypothetical protein EVAR_46576_1 [Eumeta japonica]|uniref:Uncharacterized protein n=1 Tax=Eumeta variegata TaxID=151549 RepID=A0A4C1WSM5_EUMVA|nr:hypothetical protein EVAR_46576_1 [Eumeta japonica]